MGEEKENEIHPDLEEENDDIERGIQKKPSHGNALDRTIISGSGVKIWRGLTLLFVVITLISLSITWAEHGIYDDRTHSGWALRNLGNGPYITLIGALIPIIGGLGLGKKLLDKETIQNLLDIPSIGLGGILVIFGALKTIMDEREAFMGVGDGGVYAIGTGFYIAIISGIGLLIVTSILWWKSKKQDADIDSSSQPMGRYGEDETYSQSESKSLSEPSDSVSSPPPHQESRESPNKDERNDSEEYEW